MTTKLTLTRVSSTNTRKDGTALINKFEKAYWRVGLQAEEYGDRWINGFSNDNPSWQAGDVIEVEIAETEWNGQPQLNFRLPKKEDVQAQKIKELEDALKEKGAEIGHAEIKKEDSNESDPF